MKLESLEITNFMGIAHAHLCDLKSVVLFFGRNGHGKSSGLFALKYLLCGWCERTGRAGQNASRMIRDGAKEALVAGYFSHEGERYFLEATLKRKGTNEFLVTTNNGEVLDIETRERFWKKLGIDIRFTQVAAMPEIYFQEKPGVKELGGLLAELLTGDIDQDQLWDIMVKHYRDSKIEVEWNDFREFLSALGDKEEFDTSSVAGLAAIGALADTRRKEAKRVLTTHKTDEEELSHGLPGIVRDEDEKELHSADLPVLKQLNNNLDKELEALFMAAGVAKEGVILDDEFVEKLEAQLAAAEELYAEQGEIKNKEEVNLQTKRDVEVATAQELKTIDAELFMLQKMINNDTYLCPTCKEHTVETQRVIQKTRLDLLSRIEQDRAVVSTQYTVSTNANVEFASTQRKRARLKSELKDLLASAYTGRPLAEIQEEIDVNKAEVEQNKTTIAKLTQLVDHEGAVQRVKMAAREVAIYHHLVLAFRDGEVTRQLMNDGLQGFIDMLNAEVVRFGDYSMDIIVKNKTVDMMMSPPKEGYRLVSECSGGQNLIAEFALVAALGTGAPRIFEEVSRLDFESKDVFIAGISESTSSVVMAGALQLGDLQSYQEESIVTTVSVEDGEFEVIGEQD